MTDSPDPLFNVHKSCILQIQLDSGNKLNDEGDNIDDDRC